MRIGLIDVDGHRFPNLALMKISAWHKSHGDQVEWYDVNTREYDIVYCSKVFSEAYTPDIPDPPNARTIVRGGTGYAIRLEGDHETYDINLDPPLPYEVEHQYPDYGIYPEFTGVGLPLHKQTAFGFLTRGCPRACAFCHVAPKEGRASKTVAELSEFWSGQGTIRLCDPNILACPDAKKHLLTLISTGAKVDFNQGLDARLITTETANLLAKIRCRPHFAMDRLLDCELVANGIRKYVQAKRTKDGRWDWRNAKVYMLVNYDTSFEEDMYRINLIRKCECWPYVMVYDKPHSPRIFRRLQRWCNNPQFFMTTASFEEFQSREYAKSIEAWERDKDESIANYLTRVLRGGDH